MNLYLYMPPLSAHLPSCFKGPIAGELIRHWQQSSPEKLQTIICKVYQMTHKERPYANWHCPNLGTTNTMHNTNLNKNMLYIHRTYHKSGLQKADIQRLYNKILGPHLDFDKIVITMSRAANV
jgi:hypothetical protein